MYYKCKIGIISIENMGYTKTAIKGISWAWGLSFSLRFISFIRVIVLARILSPDQFGVYGIALLMLALLETLTETGVNVFLIQEKERLEKYIDSAWIVSIFRGIIISFFMFVLSGFIASFFHSPNAMFLLMLFSLVPLIRGFINPSEIKFQKNINFDKEFWYRLLLFLVDTGVSVIVVYFTHQIFGLAVGAIVGVILQVILSFALISPRPKFVIEKSYLSKIFHSGKWITISGIFNYLFHNLDNIVVGRILGASSLGLYEMAYNISMLPITDVSNVISKVTFPVYSLISDDKKRLKKAFLKTIILLSLITVPFGIVLLIFTNQLVELFLGNKWLGMVGVLKILVMFGVLRAITGFPAALFLSLGKQNYVTVITFVSVLSLLITIVPLVHAFGILGAGMSALIGAAASIPFISYYTYKVFKS